MDRTIKFTFNVNKYCIEKDDRFFAYVNVVGANRIVKFLNEQEKRMEFLKEELKDYSDDNARLGERIIELEEENGRMKGAFKRKFDYDIEDVVDEICDEDW